MYYQQMQQMALQQQSQDDSFNTFTNLNQNQLLEMYGQEQQNFENESEEAYEEGQHDSRVVKTVRSLKRQNSASKGSLGNLQKPPGGIALSGLGTTATTGGRSFGIPVMGNITQQSNRPVMV